MKPKPSRSKAPVRKAAPRRARSTKPAAPASPTALATYRSLVEELNEGLLLLAPDGTIRYANPRFAEWVQTPAHQLPGTSWHKCFIPEEQARLDTLLKVASNRPTRQELHLDSPAPRPVALSLRALQHAPAPGFSVTVTDLTERKAAEAALNRANATLEHHFQDRTAELDRAQAQLLPLYRALQAHAACSRALLRVQDEPAFLEEVCRVVVETCGYSLVCIGFAELDYSVRIVASAGFEQAYLETLHITWDETERGQGPTGRAIRTGKPQLCNNVPTDPCMGPWREKALQRGLGSALALPLIAAGKAFGTLNLYAPKPNTFSDEEVELLNQLAADVSQGITTLRLRHAHAEAMAALARSKEELERLVAERTAKLQELVGELEHFSYTITHDMRAPLRAMRGFAELVLDLSEGSPQTEQQALLRRIIHSAQRMDLLITDALSYSKAVRQELPLGPVDIGALLRGMLDSYPEFQTARARIELQGEFPLVLGNPAGLTQCFSNLLGNAIKFTKPGQIPEVRIWAEELLSPTGPTGPTGPTDTPPPPAKVRILVQDQGIGIARSMLPRVFNMFARGSNEYEGTGIGLALVRKVVDRMGGRVGVESEPGQGSCFWLELLAADPRRPLPPILPSPPPDARSIL